MGFFCVSIYHSDLQMGGGGHGAEVAPGLEQDGDGLGNVDELRHEEGHERVEVAPGMGLGVGVDRALPELPPGVGVAREIAEGQQDGALSAEIQQPRLHVVDSSNDDRLESVG